MNKDTHTMMPVLKTDSVKLTEYRKKHNLNSRGSAINKILNELKK